MLPTSFSLRFGKKIKASLEPVRRLMFSIRPKTASTHSAPAIPEGYGHHPPAPQKQKQLPNGDVPTQRPPRSPFPPHGSCRDRRSRTQQQRTAPPQQDGKLGAWNAASLRPLGKMTEANTGPSDDRLPCGTWHYGITNGGGGAGKRGACVVASAHGFQAQQAIRYVDQLLKRSRAPV